MAEEPETPEQEPQPDPEPETGREEPAKLPNDHPLVKAYQATKDELTKAKSRVKEFEDATKSEQERQTERLAELERQSQQASLEAARLRVALDKGLTLTQAKRLVGETDEELAADADELLATFAPPEDPAPSVSRRPRERLKPGATPSADPELDPDEFAARLFSENRI